MHRATSHLSKPILSELLRAKMAHTVFCISSCAPASVSSLTTSALPSWAARWRAVTPSCRYDRGEIFASKLMTSTRCDYTQAQCIEVSNGKNILCDCYNHHNILAQSAKIWQVFSYIWCALVSVSELHRCVFPYSNKFNTKLVIVISTYTSFPCMLSWALASTSSLTISTCPPNDAVISGVQPFC